MVQRVVSILIFLHVIALHTSIAGMELFSSLLLVSALILTIRRKVSFRTPFQTPILVFAVVMTLNLLTTPSSIPLLERAHELRWIFLYWGLTKCLQWVWRPDFEKILIKVWGFCLSVAAVYGLFQFYSGIDLFRKSNIHLMPWGKSNFRATGFFSQSLTYAYALVLSGISALLPARKVHRLMPSLILVSTLIIALASLARGAWLALFVAALTLLGFVARKLSQKQIFGLATIGILFLAFLLSTNTVRERVQNMAAMKSDESTSIRADLIKGYLHIFKEHPIWGAGYGQGQAFLKKAFEDLSIDQEFISHAHNDYLQFLAETGIIGLLSFLLLIGWNMWMTYGLRKRDFYWAISLLCGQIFIFLGCATQANFTDSEVVHFLVFNWALSSALITSAKEKA